MKSLRLATVLVPFALAGCVATAPVNPQSDKVEMTYGEKPAKPQPAVTIAPSLDPSIPKGPLNPVMAEEFASKTIARTQPPTDLWDRIRRGYTMPNLETDLVRQQEQYYATRPDYIQRMADRSRKYMFHIVEEVERRGMPSELALLPFIESAFNPQAVSSARAAGMWQFMPATGKDFDLKQNVFRDDRRDVLQSTRAALDYLQRLYGMFGDWHLALAAYNWGEGSVKRAIERNQRSGLGVGYLDLNMPNETRNYVPKLQAVKNIVGNPELFRNELPVVENHPYFQTVMLTRDMDVMLAARLADVNIDDFRALNPQHNRPVILAAGTPQILLPWDNAAVFKRNFDAYSEGKLASWTAWNVPATMSVGEAAKRVGMNESDLRSVNTIPPRMIIKSGSILIVPRNAARQDDVTSQVADHGQLSLAPEIVTRRTLVRAGKRDTVASIAQRYKLAASQVGEWNQLSAQAAFKPGQQVVLHLPMRSAAAAPASRQAVRVPAKAVVRAAAPMRKVAPAPKKAAAKRR